MSDATDGAESTDARRERRSLVWIEIIATTLLAFATVATAWSGYQATRWGGEATKASAAANAARVNAARQADLANTQKAVDVEIFIAWVDAFALGNVFLMEFYDARFREEFKPALDAWVATQPLQNPDAPLTPFVMPEYVLVAEQEAARLDEQAAGKVQDSLRNIQRQSNYVLGAVLFATALFFAGMSSKVGTRGARIALLACGLIVFVSAAIWLATMPVSFGV